MTKNCLTLIGMPAFGKSSVGVVLAKKTGRRFIDGDLLIQEQSGKLLKDLIAERGDDGFRALEDETLAALETENAVIAPGGSVIYGEKARVSSSSARKPSSPRSAISSFRSFPFCS